MLKMKKIQGALLFLSCLVLCCAAPGCSSFVAQTSQQVEVKRVVDGDTVELKDGKFARYIGIDCPELERKTSSGWVEVNDPFALEAKKANEELVLRYPVVFEFDACKLDKYNRFLVYCYAKVEGRKVLVQSELLKRGLAYLYTFPPNVKYTDILVEFSNDARRHKRGVWSLDLDVNSKDARQFVGQRKAVIGRVKNVFSTEKIMCLKLDGLDVVIFDKDMDTFLKKHLDPAVAYQEKTIRVFGLIKEYKGRLEIIVSHPSQIDVLEG